MGPRMKSVWIGALGFSMQSLVPMSCVCAQTQGDYIAQARSVGDFIDAVGVNTHIDARSTSYADLGRVVASLNYVGFRYVRDDALEGGIPFNADRYLGLLSTGVKIDIASGNGGNAEVSAVVDAAEQLEQARPGSVCFVEGYNEIDEENDPVTFDGKVSNPGSGFYQPDIDAQNNLYNAVHSNPNLRNIGVLNFTFAYATRSGLVGDVKNDADYTNVHAYAVNGSPPGRALSTLIRDTVDSPGKPIVVTETGYPTIYPGSEPNKNFVDEKVQEMYLLDAILDDFKNNVVRTYIYELLDRRANPGDTTDQDHYGIFRYDGTPKPSATSIKSMFEILQLRAKSLSNDVATNPSYHLYTSSGIPVSYIVLEKSPSTYDFIIWSEPKIWNASASSVISEQDSGDVTIKFPKIFSMLQVFDPTTGTDAITQVLGQNQYSYEVKDHPVIIEVRF